MKREGGRLYAVRIETEKAFAELVETGLALQGGRPASWLEEALDRAVIEEFFETRAEAMTRERVVREWLTEWAEGESWRVSLRSLAVRDWAESWKRFFHTERVSERVVIKPSWEAYPPQPGDCVVELDPGMSFGTGQHATTRACLQFLDEAMARQPAASFLDVGCGSGILSIAAAKLGCRPVTAIDNDPDAVRVTRENAARNGVEDRLACRVAELGGLADQAPADVVAANILADVLEQNAEALVRLVSQREYSLLILSGILRQQYSRIRRVYAALGFMEIGKRSGKEWTSGCFRRRRS